QLAAVEFFTEATEKFNSLEQWSGAYDADFYRAVALLAAGKYRDGRILLRQIIDKQGGRTEAASRLLRAIDRP
ncbi:MAG: hypothetical protein AAFU03_18050, partial [Bacteroidota bacterium]